MNHPGTEPSATSVSSLPRISRRHALIGLAALLAQAGFWSNPLSAAQAPASAPATGLAPATMLFYTLSQTITGHRDLSAATAARIEQAMRTNVPGFADRLPQLGELLVTGQEAKVLLAAATAADASLRELALAIVAAWYTGTVAGNAAQGTKSIVVAYAEALMYRTVADGQVVPTYCNYGPLWWLKAPPAVRVSAPVEPKPVPAPATTGTPEPKGKQAK
ncbi:Fructose dehydrogenase small subunit precursor [Janthinobacterium sp. KBS0711]|uniref:sugar dehydrogenase complex small subunit n=1 Tax=Janthinobacterium sp. KBS0711 TaxID=1649647 RepID=UPI000627AD6A|nr:sugar dehydrogenase complex small subunit [Janthinobacterium sp. KBS0711]KKO60926.1 Fructose dehydrogenase small subunit precursor [Janthinobacterium sp. KBS0711]TSD73198.1 D-sorbitol dehydrogenase [Janthinobacterium sp. KBS0711]